MWREAQPRSYCLISELCKWTHTAGGRREDACRTGVRVCLAIRSCLVGLFQALVGDPEDDSSSPGAGALCPGSNRISPARRAHPGFPFPNSLVIVDAENTEARLFVLVLEKGGFLISFFF